MTFKELKHKIKEEQKVLAEQIRRGKFLRKPKHRTNLTDDDKKLFFRKFGQTEWFLDTQLMSLDYRVKHIAYCILFNNTPYGMIEQPRESETYINALVKSRYKEQIKKWEEELDGEAVRTSAA